jgi:urease accessory protein
LELGGPAPTSGIDVASAVVRPGRGRSDVHRARGAGPLRLLFPRSAGDAAWIVTSSLGGGLVDGDAVALDVSVDAGATAVITTQASTKVYKGTSQQRTHVRVAGDGAALVVPDPVVPYRDACFMQVTTIDLASASTLVLCDVLTAGRVAYGERWSATRLDTTLRLSIDGALALHDRIVLANAEAHMQRFTALATAVLFGPRVSDLAATQLATLPAVERRAPVIVAGSPLGTPCHRSDEAAPRGVAGALFRICGDDVESVVKTTRDLLRDACSRLGEDPWSRKW